MGKYITKDDLKKQISEQELIVLTDDEATGQVNEQVVEENIEDAESIIDAYLRRRYALPIEPVPTVVKKLAVDITVYNLESRRRAPTEERRQNYEDAIQFLRDVSKGIVALDVIEEPAAPEECKPDIKANERIFTRDTLKDF